ncbi:MAG TPA: GYF domain-containing protein [Pirellulaceae bacterium]|jgi:hypothetical protein|nr:GYF domain-containing protein [Pirellulaceae bacterium]
MGIRVFCPNGHRLNLKSHLAGKQGICPHCGMTVTIPSLEKAEELGMLKNPRLSGGEAVAGGIGGAEGSRGGAAVLTMESAPPTAANGKAAEATREPGLASPYAPSHARAANGSTGNKSGGNGASGNGSGAYGAAAPHQDDRAAARLDDGGIEIPLKSEPSAAPAKRTSSTADASAVVAEPVPAAAPVENEIDPIDENPQAVWYVRTPQGGQYGPAAGDIMRKWIAEGRVQADFWVWREGWGDWQKASSSIPSLRRAGGVAAPMAPSAGGTSAPSTVAAPAKSAPVAAPAKSGEPSAYPASDAASTPRAARTRRRGIHPLAILAVVGLGLVCLALFGVLVAMLAGAI